MSSVLVNGFFNFFRAIDYRLQDRKGLIFVKGAFIVVIIAPMIDYIIKPRNISFTVLSTYFYLIFILSIIIAWFGKFRDEKNEWSFDRVKQRLKLTGYIIKDVFFEIQSKNASNKGFVLSVWLLISGFVIKALQNISEIIRYPLQQVGFRMKLFKIFESWTNLGYILFFIGVLILFYLHFKKVINVFDVFFRKKELPHLIRLNLKNYSVVNLNETERIKNLINANPDSIFRATMEALLDWKPKHNKKEVDYEINLLKHLNKKLKPVNLTVKNQYSIKSGSEKGVVDICVNQSIYIELKNKIKSGEIDRATGQILKYQRILQIIKNNNIPLILLIVNVNYNDIIKKLSEFIYDYNKKNKQKLLCVIANPD